VSTATRVPETWELTGDDARKTLASVGVGQLAKDSWQRLRFADGFSHARSLAFTIALVLVQAIIALVGLASVLGKGVPSDIIVRSLQAAVPGPAGRTLTNAVLQAHKAGASHQYFGLAFGLIGSIITGSTLMGQIERALNRLYGVEQDRPTVKKYALAVGLAITAGVLATLAAASLAFGRSIGRSLPHSAATVWGVARWPLGLLLMMGAIALLFRYSPRRHQPRWSWLAFGASVSVLLWCAVTVGLGAFFGSSSSFGDTYGPLAGTVALLLWSLLSSVALLFGASLAAQLEAVRAGALETQDERKVIDSEPESSELVGSNPR
jgi:YihY family inner membrane protein